MKRLQASMFIALVCMISTFGVRADEVSIASDAVYRYVNLQSSIRSWNPTDPVQTHKQHSSGSCSHGGTVGIGVGFGENKGFTIQVRCLPGKQRIAAEIKIEPAESSTTLQASTTEVDLSDLKTKYIEVTKTDDGRIYYLIIEPVVREVKLPTQFNAEKLAVYDWDFPSSPVILNDEIYVGRVGMSGGPLVGIDIAGVANIEFSLLPLKDAKPIGTLQDGTLAIKIDDHAIVITGVRNGAAKQTLDGPYKVWVKKVAGSGSVDEMRKLFREQLQVVEKRKADGDSSITDEVIARIKGFIESGRPMLLGSHARSLRDDELGE